MSTEKKTKITKFEEIIEILESAENELYGEYIELLQTEIEHLENKAAKAKAKAAEKKTAPDPLYDAVVAALTDTLSPISTIVERIEGVDEVTVGKVTPRLTKAVAAGVAKKEPIAVEGRKTKVMGYCLVVTPEAE